MSQKQEAVTRLFVKGGWWAIWLPLFFGGLRLVAATGDLAIDEVWSLRNAQLLQHVFHVFLFRHDNNHLLNTMVMYVMGPNWPGWCYRLPAVAASIATVWFGAQIVARRAGTTGRNLAWLILGGSYLLVLYGSEARGYSYAVFCGFLSWFMLLRVEATRRWSDAIAFATFSSLGFLSHLTFVYCYAGFCVWTICKFVSTRSWFLVLLHIPPAGTAIGLYLFFIRGMAIGGGPETNLVDAIISTLSIMGGGPMHGDISVIDALIMLTLIVIGFIRQWQFDRAAAACFLTIIVLAPAVVLFITEHSLIYPRYFLVPVSFALLLTIDGITFIGKTGWNKRIIAYAIVAAYLIGNGWWNLYLLDHGRGDYSQAIDWMASRVQDKTETVASDHPFRNRIMFAYFAERQLPGGTELRYFDEKDISREGTDWYIRHNFDGDPPQPEVINDSMGNSYSLERTYRHHSLTGWNWWIYRRNTKIQSR